jgi:hypothetical protein
MRKFERFLSDISPLVKIVIVIVWALWALQSTGTIKESFSTARKNGLTYEEEQRALRELDTLSMKFGKEAEALGENYTPKEYYAHLETYKRAAYEKKIGPTPQKSERFRIVLHRNFNARRFTSEEITEAGRAFNKWYDSIKEPVDMPTLQEFGSWALTMYLRTILLVIPYYFLSMISSWRGIAETILADKTKFACAVILWPKFFFDYPRNVVREIRVEAELRRLKGLFRKLSPREMVLVRKIANGPDYLYRQWLLSRKNQNRGLTVALIVTILINLLLPAFAIAQLIPIRAITLTDCEQLDNDIGGNTTTQIAAPAIIEATPLTEPQIMIAIAEVIEFIWESVEPDGIDRVPELSLLSTVRITSDITAIAKGDQNESDQIHNHPIAA